jgi:hypothetical protein
VRNAVIQRYPAVCFFSTAHKFRPKAALQRSISRESSLPAFPRLGSRVLLQVQTVGRQARERTLE